MIKLIKNIIKKKIQKPKFYIKIIKYENIFYKIYNIKKQIFLYALNFM